MRGMTEKKEEGEMKENKEISAMEAEGLMYKDLDENFFKDESGLLKIVQIIDTAAEAMHGAAVLVNIDKDQAKRTLKFFENRFGEEITEVLPDLFAFRSLIHQVLNLKYDNHELCSYFDKAFSIKKAWLCFSDNCKHPDYPSFKLLDY